MFQNKTASPLDLINKYNFTQKYLLHKDNYLFISLNRAGGK